jgi:hypothetical protein
MTAFGHIDEKNDTPGQCMPEFIDYPIQLHKKDAFKGCIDGMTKILVNFRNTLIRILNECDGS